MTQLPLNFEAVPERAQRRKSLWNLLLVPLVILATAGVAILLTKGLLAYQNSLIPKGAILGGGTQMGHILISLLILPSIMFGMILANLIIWCVPPARRALDAEAKGVPGTSFMESNRSLLPLAMVALALVLPVNVIGIMNYFYIVPDGIYYRPIGVVTMKHYHFDDIVEVLKSATVARRSLNLQYQVKMNDGVKIELMREDPLAFVNAYERIRPLLMTRKRIRYAFRISAEGNRVLQGVYKKKARWILAILADPPPGAAPVAPSGRK